MGSGEDQVGKDITSNETPARADTEREEVDIQVTNNKVDKARS